MVPVHVALVRAGAEARLRNAMLLAGLVLWLLYTRVFWTVRAVHATLPACPFLAITGHPCPLCGGTRSFAYMWQGEVGNAARLYPLGPLLFAGTLVAIPLLAVALLARRDLAVRVPERLRRAAYGGGLGILAVSWALKLTVLPN
ncbi:MAG TPA: DUF2752 domain-containing protein [Candidatus Eisenbacteria bacterium]|nr:DUF2752 domain-containing protein [Candidatus Eisenbacteria bacterium]